MCIIIHFNSFQYQIGKRKMKNKLENELENGRWKSDLWNLTCEIVKLDLWNLTCEMANGWWKRYRRWKKDIVEIIWWRWNIIIIDRWYFLMTLKYWLLHRWNFRTKHDDYILNRHFGSRFECPYFISNLNHWHTRFTENTNAVTDHIEYIILLFSIIFNHTS